MRQLPLLNPGDSVEIIAPASRCTPQRLQDLRALLSSWQLNCVVAEDIFGDDLLCANSDQRRLSLLKNALERPDTKAIICVRGGYGSMRLIPALSDMQAPTTPKLLVGMSDITALNLYFMQAWHWPVLHAALASDIYSPESIAAVKAMLFGEVEEVEMKGVPLNDEARKRGVINTTITGGNLCLVQAGIGTVWQLDGRNKIIFLEETGERGYRVDRMLAHLTQANLLKDAAAILFGDFIGGKEADGSSLIKPVLERFAQAAKIPVVEVQGIGHDHTNFPLPLGTTVRLELGDEIKLIM